MHQRTPAKPAQPDAHSVLVAPSAQAVFQGMPSQQIYACQIVPAIAWLVAALQFVQTVLLHTSSTH